MRALWLRLTLALAASFAVGVLMLLAAAAAQAAEAPSDEEVLAKYEEIRDSLDRKHPGLGTDSFYGPPRHWPTAYAAVLGAEARRYQGTGARSALRMMRRAGRWLIRNSDLNENGITGWGWPFAYAPFGSLNPPHTEYTVAIGGVTGNLLRWLRFDPEAPRAEILRTVRRAQKAWLKEAALTPTGYFGYSLQAADRRFDVYNVGTRLTTPMLRFARITSGRRLKRRLRGRVDRIMTVLLESVRTSPEGNPFWPYSTQFPERPNDLGHAVSVINGIRDYQVLEGELGGRFDSERLLEHVLEFREGSRWRLYPSFYRHGPREIDPCFLAGPLGLALKEPRLRERDPGLIDELLTKLFRGCPVSPDDYVRSKTGMLNTLAEYLWGKRRRGGY